MTDYIFAYLNSNYEWTWQICCFLIVKSKSWSKRSKTKIIIAVFYANILFLCINNYFILGESAETLLSIKNGGYPSIDEIKSEVIDDDTMDMDDQQISNNSTDSHMDTEESDPIPELGPAALGLQRVGSQPPPKPNPPSQPVQVLNRRGMPARIRKKNKLFYDDILVNHPHHR